MGEGFAPPTVEEVFRPDSTERLFECGACYSLVLRASRQGHIDWHRRNGDAVFALFHADIGIKRGEKRG